MTDLVMNYRSTFLNPILDENLKFPHSTVSHFLGNHHYFLLLLLLHMASCLDRRLHREWGIATGGDQLIGREL